jgi:hypothetical protein
VFARSIGALQMVGGAVEFVKGFAASTTGIGVILGGPMMLHGMDNFVAGARTWNPWGDGGTPRDLSLAAVDIDGDGKAEFTIAAVDPSSCQTQVGSFEQLTVDSPGQPSSLVPNLIGRWMRPLDALELDT